MTAPDLQSRRNANRILGPSLCCAVGQVDLLQHSEIRRRQCRLRHPLRQLTTNNRFPYLAAKLLRYPYGVFPLHIQYGIKARAAATDV